LGSFTPLPKFKRPHAGFGQDLVAARFQVDLLHAQLCVGSPMGRRGAKRLHDIEERNLDAAGKFRFRHGYHSVYLPVSIIK